MTYSFPCQDLSIAGKRKGMEKNTNTRSGLLWEVERLLNETKELPDILIMENVPQVLKANGWYDWCFFLEKKGYSNYAQVLNAKDYGIPQNRQRCFMVSILGEYNYSFPKGFELEHKVNYFLEKNVDEKYFLSDKMIVYVSQTGSKNFNNHDCKINLDIARPLTTDQNKRGGTTNYISEVCPDNFDLSMINKADELLLLLLKRGELKDINSACACDSSLNEPKVKEVVNCVTTRIDAGIQPNHKSVGTCIVETSNKRLINTIKNNKETLQENSILDCYNNNNNNSGVMNTITTRINSSNETFILQKAKKTDNYIAWKEKGLHDIACRAYYEDKIIPTTTTKVEQTTKILLRDLRIRKLTPKECFRLMGVKDSDSNKITCSNNQKYKQAGNSIVTSVLMAIYSQLFDNLDYKYYIKKLIKEIKNE